MKGFRILVYAKEQHPCLLREESPHTIDAPTRFVGVHHPRIGQQRAQYLKLTLPMPGQTLQQRVRLCFTQRQMLQELQTETNLVKGQAHDINEVSDLEHDLHTEFAAAEHAGNLAVLVVGTAKDVVGDQDRPALFETPHRPRV